MAGAAPRAFQEPKQAFGPEGCLAADDIIPSRNRAARAEIS